jgi:hypothetical protein
MPDGKWRWTKLSWFRRARSSVVETTAGAPTRAARPGAASRPDTTGIRKVHHGLAGRSAGFYEVAATPQPVDVTGEKIKTHPAAMPENGTDGARRGGERG